MKTIHEKIKLNKYTSKIYNMYFKEKKFAVLDIETTGLSTKYCRIILSGLLLFDSTDTDGTAQTIQFFAEQPDDEKAILQNTLEILASVDYIITYNGRHFDMPFIKARCEKYGLSVPLLYDFDLYQIIASSKSLREVLPGLRQKDIEFYMGLCSSRLDEISGGDSVKLYERYMSQKSFDLEEKILLHNHDDIIQLYKILPIIEKLNFHMAMYKKGFCCGNFIINKISIKGRTLHVLGKQKNCPADYISFPTEEKPYSLILDAKSQDFELIVPCEKMSDALILDAAGLLGSKIENIEKYPSVTDGYLIAAINSVVNHMEVNAFIIELISKFSKEI